MFRTPDRCPGGRELRQSGGGEPVQVSVLGGAESPCRELPSSSATRAPPGQVEARPAHSARHLRHAQAPPGRRPSGWAFLRARSVRLDDLSGLQLRPLFLRGADQHPDAPAVLRQVYCRPDLDAHSLDLPAAAILGDMRRTPSYSARQFLTLSDNPPGRTDRIRRADSPKAALFTEVSPSSTRFRSRSCSSQLTPHVHGVDAQHSVIGAASGRHVR